MVRETLVPSLSEKGVKGEYGAVYPDLLSSKASRKSTNKEVVKDLIVSLSRRRYSKELCPG